MPAWQVLHGQRLANCWHRVLWMDPQFFGMWKRMRRWSTPSFSFHSRLESMCFTHLFCFNTASDRCFNWKERPLKATVSTSECNCSMTMKYLVELDTLPRQIEISKHMICATQAVPSGSLHIPQQFLVVFLLRAWLIRHLLCLYWTLNRNTLTQVGRIQCEHGITGLSLSRSDLHVCLANLSDAPPLLIDFKAQESVTLAYPSAGETLTHLSSVLWCSISCVGSLHLWSQSHLTELHLSGGDTHASYL